MNKKVDMLSGSIIKGLLTISIPIMIMNVLQSVFNIIDLTILKTFDTGNGYSVGAVGACGSLITLITGLMIGISAGSNVIVAKYIGMNDTNEIEKAVGVSILFSIAGGVVLLTIGTCFAKYFLEWTNCPDLILPQATLYFRLYFVGVPFILLYNFCAAILRATGDSKRPMVFLTIGGIVKICLTLFFVGVLKMKIVGVAISTISSWILTSTLTFLALNKNNDTVKIKFNRIKFYKSLLKEILFIGIPTALQQAFYSIANVIISATVNTFGPDATTGISIANTFDGILYHISIAPALAVMPYVSQNIGARNHKRATKSVGSGLLITIMFGATLGALSAIFSAQLSSLMSDSPAVIAYSRQKMVLISSTYFICGINEIMGASLRGMNKPIVATVCSLIFMCILRFVWVYLIFPLYPTLTFLYLVWPIGWVLSIITTLFFYVPTVKSFKKDIFVSIDK